MKKMQIQGNVAKGFESVKALFIEEMNTKAEDNAQLCVYHKGEKVVDLWASNSPGNGFNPDSVVNLFSSGKSLEAIALASLVQKGLLSYDANIADYWPEFANNDKGDITVADLMRHEAGLVDFRHTFDPIDFHRENIKKNSVGKIIEPLRSYRSSDPDARRVYHPMTRGWIANELFRRIEPDGKTIGEFLKEDISGPLNTDVFIGMEKEDLAKRHPITTPLISFQFFASFKPSFLGKRFSYSIFTLSSLFSSIAIHILKKRKKSMLRKKKEKLNTKTKLVSKPKNVTPLKGFSVLRYGHRAIKYFNKDVVSQGESPSFAAHGSARGLSKIAAMMAAGGKFGGKEYFNEAAWQAMHGNIVKSKMEIGLTSHFSQGGVNLFTLKNVEKNLINKVLSDGREGFVGWMGLGGSIFQWHPEKDIGFAFVPTTMHLIDILNERGKVYQAEVLRCVDALA